MSVVDRLAAAFADAPHDPSRDAAFARFASTGLPGRKAEAWRWSDLSAVEALAGAAANDGAVDPRRWLIDGLDGPVLVFVGGRYRADLSDPRQVAVKGAAGDAPAHPLGDLATAFASGGAVLRVGAGHATSGPVQLIHVGIGAPAHLRHRIELGEDAQASIVETYVGSGWTNVAADVALARSARLMRTVRQAMDGGLFTDLTRAQVGQGASYASTSLITGGDSARSEAQLRLTGTGAFASVDGLLLARGRQTLDVVNRVAHLAEGGQSRQTWRVVADDNSTASFSGGIDVARGAQKTDAAQSFKALLLKRTATANAKPELEIFADDVKCAHGATVGELDRAALFYLASRGVAPAEAKALLTRSFLDAALAGIGEERLREAVGADVDAWLEGGR